MKVPTKTVIMNDWDALWECIKDGQIVVVTDMTSDHAMCFRIWARKWKKALIQANGLFSGGYEIKGSLATKATRKYTKKEKS